MPTQRNTAFSLVEVLLAIALIGSVAALAVSSMSHVVKSAQTQKLASDVDTINRSIVAYIASGGDLSQAKTPEDVLSALKQKLANGDKVPGLAGSKLDATVTAKIQTKDEVYRGGLRAYWDAKHLRFYLTNKGEIPGVKSFEKNPSLDTEDFGESEANVAFSYASKDKWIWDYAEAAASSAPGTTAISVTPVPNTGIPTPKVTPPPPPPPSVADLDPPIYSRPGGSYPIEQFEDPIALSNPNPAGSSRVFYSIDYGEWLPYLTPVIVPPGSSLSAQAVASTAAYTNS